MARATHAGASLAPLALRGLHHVRRCLHGLDGLPCFLLRLRRRELDWWELLEDVRRLRPFDFEFHFGVAPERDAYHSANLRRAVRSGAPVRARLRGFSDLYVPIARRRGEALVFYAGQWATELPTLEGLAAEWQRLSGNAPGEADPAFRRYVRCALEVPVLDEDTLAGLVELAGEMATLVGGRDTRAALSRIEALRRRVFLPRAVDHEWVRATLDLEGLTVPPWGLDVHLDRRLVEELRLARAPTFIGVLLLHHPEARATRHELESLVEGRRLQLEAMQRARQLPGVVIGPLGDRGVIVALAVPHELRGRARPAHARRVLASLQALLQREARLPTVGGLGGERPPEEGTGPSYREASFAASVAVARGAGTLLTFRECSREEGAPAPVDRNRASLLDVEQGAERLVTSVRDRRHDRLVPAGTAFVRELSAREGMNTSAIRSALLALAARLFSELVRTRGIERTRADELMARLETELGHAATAVTLIDLFTRELEELGHLVASEAAADRDTRVAAALRWLESELPSEQPLERAAARAGLSPSSFRRLVRERTGTSFGRWLRARRIEAARELLLQSDAPIRTIASEVGFGEVHAFIRAFREARGETPAAYREARR